MNTKNDSHATSSRRVAKLPGTYLEPAASPELSAVDRHVQGDPIGFIVGSRRIGGMSGLAARGQGPGVWAARIAILGTVLAMCQVGRAAVADEVATAGGLTQKPGTAGCISQPVVGAPGPGPCAAGRGLAHAVSVTISPDGTNAYVASFDSDAVAVFDRAKDGTLTQKLGTAGCISDTGADGCADGTALDGAYSVTVSPDGASAYVTSAYSDAVAVFDRARDGTLVQKQGTAGCISNSPFRGCTGGRALGGPLSLTVSPDGASAYVASYYSHAVVVFDRAEDGTLTQKPGTAGCISNTGAYGCVGGTALAGARSVTVSPDGASAYVASTSSGAVGVFDRAEDGTLTQKPGTAGCISNTGAYGCVGGTALAGARSVTVSPDGASAYVASYDSDAVALLDRAADGTLSQKPGTSGCISNSPSRGCTGGRALDGATSVTVSPDGASAYVASVNSNAVAVFDRRADGTLTQKWGTTGCISDTGTEHCADGRALDRAFSVAVSPDGTSAYVASASFGSSTVAVFDRATGTS